MPSKHLVLVLALGGCLSCAAATPQPTRGVHPNHSEHYVAGSDNTFQCLDGSVRLPFDRVNDDFCDCPDGSDEPGTAACPNGRFFCRNRGHVSKTLASAFVNDGICDCCDGSDEERGCNNFCAELGSAARLEKAALLKDYQAGAAARAQLLRDAKARRQSWLQQEALLIAKVEKLKPVVAELQEIKDKLRAERDALLPAEEPHDVADVEDAADAVDEDPVEWHDPRDPSQWEEDDPEHEAYHEAGFDSHDEAGGSAEDQAAEDEEEDPEEVGRRIAAQWTSDPDAAMKQTEGAAAQQAADAGQQCDAGDQQCANTGDVVEQVAEAADEASDGAADAKPAGGFLKSVRDLVGGIFGKNGSATEEAAPEDVDAARRLREDVERRYQEAEQNHSREQDLLTEAESALADVQTKIKRDHGPDDLFSYLDGACYDSTEGKYTYSICGFGDARQREGQSSTMLGTFAGFEDHHNTITYTQGDVCWQGPARSLKVELKCGVTTQLHSVTEPSRCQYASVLVTPAACSPDIVAALAAELAALEEEVRSIKK